jgi:2-(1,2-epoxy-1,2-dihydrophenyl)acetyl-CoA isomerase
MSILSREPPVAGADLLADLADGVLTLTLNRPAARNALSCQLLDALADALQFADADDEVRVVVLTGAGTAFCAGGDVTRMAGGESVFGAADDPDARVAAQRRVQRATMVRLHELSKPTIAAVNGPAVGAGLGLALACDLRYLAESARLLTGFLPLGLAGDFGVTWLLRDLVGPSRATELLLLSEWVSGARAVELGLAAEVVPDLFGHVADVARRLAAASAPATRAAKANVARAGRLDLADAADKEALEHVRLTGTPEHRAAVAHTIVRRTKGNHS